jgi:hypothetical protein
MVRREINVTSCADVLERGEVFRTMKHGIRSIPIVLVSIALGLSAIVGCDSDPDPVPKPQPVAQMSLPQPNPSMDEAAELIRVCGRPDSDTQKPSSASLGGLHRDMKWRRYNVEALLEHNNVDSPKWATTSFFLINGQDAIDRPTLSKKMPCAKKTKLFGVDSLTDW